VIGGTDAGIEAARAALGRLAARGVVPGPRPSDAELLGALGIELEPPRPASAGATVMGERERLARDLPPLLD
jgi:hypothetical protein